MLYAKGIEPCGQRVFLWISLVNRLDWLLSQSLLLGFRANVPWARTR